MDTDALWTPYMGEMDMRLTPQGMIATCACALVLSGLGCGKRESGMATQNAPAPMKSYPLIADRVYVPSKIPTVSNALAKVRARPSDASAYFTLGVAYFRDKRYTDAVDAFHTGLHLHLGQWQVYRYLGYSLMGCGRLTEAVEAFGHIPPMVKMQPMIASVAYREMGNCEWGMKHYDQAETAYKQSLALDPKQGFVSLSLGALAAEKKHYDKAEGYFLEAARDRADVTTQAEAHMDIGDIAEVRGDLPKAQQEYTLAVRLNPYNTHATEKLAEMRDKLRGQ